MYEVLCLQLYNTDSNCYSSAAMFIIHGIWTSCKVWFWLLSTGENTLQHASTHQTLWSLAVFWNEDIYSSSKHIFHALISALGQTGLGIQCSTFALRLYLKDMVFSLCCAICHLKFHPFQPGAPGPLLAMFLRAAWLPVDGQPWGNQIK